MRFAVVLFSVITAALAQLTVNTPTGAISCLNQQITWTGGTAPYVIQVQPGGDPTQAAIETFTGITGTSYTWFVTEGANTQVFIRLRDGSGLTAESGTFTIRAGGTCPASGATTGAAATTSGAATTAPGATTAPTVTTPAATTTPAAGTTTTPAAGGTTTTPAAGGTTTPAATTRATTTSTGGALSLNVDGVNGAVVGSVLMGVVALLA